MTPWRRRLLVGWLCLAAYVGSYATLSAAGEYRWTFSGRLRWAGGSALTDVLVWQPRFAEWRTWRGVDGRDQSDGDFLGFCYSPLIALDRAWVHPTRTLSDL